MAYRKTESILAAIEARKGKVLAAAIDVIAKGGMEAMTTNAVAARAKVAVGLIFKYFPDMAELRAAAVAKLLARDLMAMRQAAMEARAPMPALAAGLEAYFKQLARSHLVRAMAAEPAYRMGIVAEIERLIAATSLDVTPKMRTVGAVGALGALLALEGQRGSYPVQFALRGIGVSDALARKLAEVTRAI